MGDKGKISLVLIASTLARGLSQIAPKLGAREAHHHHYYETHGIRTFTEIFGHLNT
jgi:hypothetical protein